MSFAMEIHTGGNHSGIKSNLRKRIQKRELYWLLIILSSLIGWARGTEAYTQPGLKLALLQLQGQPCWDGPY